MICFKCAKPFDPHKHSKRVCKACYSPERSRYAEAARKRKNYLWTKYRMEPDDYELLLREQDSCCAICGQFDDNLAVDHDHFTMSVRGLLCRRCNSGIGFFKEDTGYLRKAIEYLERHQMIHEESLRIAGNANLDSPPYN